jgi:site-specific DNA recombinase
MPSVADVRPQSVALYIRWSTDEQTEGTTLETQRERCSLYVRSQGWQVNEELIFIDDGYSGGSLERPAMTKLRHLIKERKIDCVVTYSLDRLSRSVADTVQLVQHEWLGKCVFRSASQPISTEDGNPTGQLIFNILASFAEFERALIRERTHSGLVRRAKQGKYPGTRVPPLGYRRDGKGNLVIDSIGADGTLQGPAAIVHKIFELATMGPIGQGPTLVARALIEKGIPSPSGGPWWTQAIRTILQNPVYSGELVYGRRRVNPAHRRDKSAPQRLYNQLPLAVVDGATPAIVSREIWGKSQQLFKDRAEVAHRKTVQAKNRSLLTGIARCKCGGPLSVFYDRQKRKHYRCSRNSLSAGGCPHSPGVLLAEQMERAVIDAVKERYGSPSLRHTSIATAASVRANGERLLHLQVALADLERRLQAIDADLARVRRAARRGEIQLATFEELRVDAEAERGILQAKREGFVASLKQAQTDDTSLSDWQAFIERVDLWTELDVTSQREILYGLLRTVIMYKPKGGAAPEIDLVWELD